MRVRKFRTTSGAVLHTKWDTDGTVTVRLGNAEPFKVTTQKMHQLIANQELKELP